MTRPLRTLLLGAVVLGTVLAAGAPTTGTTVLRFTDRELSERAGDIIHGRLVDRRSYYDADGLIVTEYTFEVDEVLKGDPVGRTYSFVQPGGRVGDRGTYIAGTARFEPSEETVVFVASPEVRGAPTFTVGLAQGKFRVERPDPSADGIVRRDLEGLQVYDEDRGEVLSESAVQAMEDRSERLASFRDQVRSYVRDQNEQRGR